MITKIAEYKIRLEGLDAVLSAIQKFLQAIRNHELENIHFPRQEIWRISSAGEV